MNPEPASPVQHLIRGVRARLEDMSRTSLLNRRGPIGTESNLPGRVRFRCEALVGNDEAQGRLTNNLRNLPGVSSVEVNVLSGSILIHYDDEVLTPELLFTAVLKLLGLEDEFLTTPQPALAGELKKVGSSLNRAVYDMTGGTTDLWTSLFIVLAVVGVYKLRREPGNAFPGGGTLLWWTFNSLLREKPGEM